jgi:hypothetical protein
VLLQSPNPKGLREMIVLTWKKAGEPEQSREYPDDRLQDLMDRANAAFGTPGLILDGPNMKDESGPISQVIKGPRRKTSKKRS